LEGSVEATVKAGGSLRSGVFSENPKRLNDFLCGNDIVKNAYVFPPGTKVNGHDVTDKGGRNWTVNEEDSNEHVLFIDIVNIY
jgi:hypothetical protein